ncbi:putative inorganic phosphate cotransporter [Battus philenor]|uniref:putative inorganic phosphate cotransporter n=1 Tax=Battus philenor TaxID=42288 RepID=UPI0035D09940
MSSEQVDYESVPVAEKNEEQEKKPPKGFGVRHVQALLLFTSLAIGLSMRAHLSVTLVAMTSNGSENLNCTELEEGEEKIHLNTNNTLKHDVNNTLEYTRNICGNEEKTSWNIYRTYEWSKPEQEMILFAFFVGYTSMMIPIGLVAQKFGGKLPICVALAVNGVLSILTPWMPLFGGWVTVCAGRLLQGMTQAAFFPSIHSLLGKWAPLAERGRLSTYIYTGSQFGTVLAFQIAGFFAGSPLFGWPCTFWFCGVMSLVCFGLLYFFGSATPTEHPHITTEELAYITKDGNADSGTKKRKTPWKHILTSKAVWGLIASHCGSALGYLLVFTQIPMYMNKVLGVDIKRNGVYSSLPYISMYFMTLLFGYLSDFAANKKLMSVTNIRRTANSIGMFISGLFLIGFSFVSDTVTAVIILILCLGLHSGVHVGFHINHIDLAPNFAGPIMATGNMIANLSGLGVPVLVSNIIGDDATNQSKWQVLFVTFASLQFVTNLIFVIFVKGTVQDWNFYGDDGNDY